MSNPTRGRLSPVRFAAWLSLSVLLAYLVFGGGGWAGIHSTEIRTTSVVIIALVLVAWAAAAARNAAWLPRSALVPGFAIALGAFALGLALSRAPRLGVEYLAYAVLLSALYLLLVRLLAHEVFRPRLMGIVVIVTLVHGFAYLAQTGIAWVEWWDLVGRIATPPLRPRFGSLLLGNPSAVMTVQVLLGIASVAWVGWSTAGARVVSAVVVFLAASATLISGSRAGWLALGGAIVVFVVLWLASGPRRRRVRESLQSRRRIALASAAGAAGAAAVVVLAPAVLLRGGALEDPRRLANFSAAVRMFLEEPLTGTGPGTWVAQRVAYLQPGEPDHYIPYAHNLPLQTMAEFGLLGVVAGVIAIAIAANVVRHGLQGVDPTTRRMAAGAVLGSLYFFGHQQLDFYGNSPAALFAFALPIAFVDAVVTGTGPATNRSRAGTIALAIGAAAATVAVAGLLLAESIASSMARAVDHANQAEWSEALPHAIAAVDRDPDIPAYQFSLATIASHAGRPDIAIGAYRRAALADDFPAAWLGLAAEQAQRGDAAAARDSLVRALRVGRQQTAVLVAAGDLYLRLGDRDAAIDALAAAVAAAPSLAGDGRWTTDPELAGLYPEVLAAARAELSEAAAIELALTLGDVGEAERVAQSLPAGPAELMGTVIHAWQGEPGALEALHQRITARPLDLEAVLWTARIAARRGDADGARDLRAWAETLDGLSSTSTYEIRLAPPDVRPLDVFGQGSRLYGHYTYRRPTPVDQVPAGLQQLSVE